ncbi:helix-turn-helix domain-containing protein [Sphingomonas sp. DG1-23]|uniref:helix-turn-helix domain-containing protein n=1 Tax=Sphingomonas sp. DG1-23 TaxID=3068316 RepID=UPI00273D0929|nr:helix-turn-helix domain-containing protein [Sphingomonas sp. DG1-23]MDP5279921.1 helix-turn-helix domain-containing protein [Sphingomonas sp. DG1-23]
MLIEPIIPAERYLSPVHLARDADAPLAVCRLIFTVAEHDAEVISMIRGPRMDEETMDMRRLVIVVARRHLAVPFPRIGRAMNRDHSAVIRTFRNADTQWREDRDFRLRANRLLVKAGVA